MSHTLLRQAIRQMATSRGMRLLKRYQDRLLRQTVAYASRNSPFYHERFIKAGLSPTQVKRREDLPRLGFFTGAADLLVDPFAFLAVPRSRVLHVMGTSGSTGKPKLTFYTRSDWERLVNKLRLGYILVGLEPGRVTQTMMCAGTREWLAGDLLHEGLKSHGIWNIPMGTVASPDDQVEAIRTFGSKILFSTPSFLSRVTAETAGRVDLPGLGVESIYVFGEASSPDMRRWLEQAWSAKVYDGYGMMEFGAAIAGECPAQSGMHLDLHIIVEVIDPQSGHVLPPGHEGELVFTSLGRQATPLLRYRSGDIGRLLVEEPCPCRMIPTPRLDHVRGRIDHKISLGTGESFYPESFDRVLAAVPGILEYQVVIDKEGYRDSIAVMVATHSPSAELAQQIVECFYKENPTLHYDTFGSKTVAELRVDFVKPGAWARDYRAKAQRLVD
ncbi:MAG: AMP-binding protein, partial [Candidatus Aminicenantes bacterium]|nr:AMP-binding protein [Candidatus Aminicenantes bacterium]